MSESEQQIDPWDHLSELIQAGDPTAIEGFLDGLRWSERARAISRLSSEQQEQLFTMLAPHEAAELMETLPEPEAAGVIERLEPEDAAPIVEELASDEQADLLGHLEQQTAEAILAEMDPGEAAEARSLSQYPPDSVGGLMVTEYVTFPEGVSAHDVLQQLQARGAEYAEYDIQYLYVVDRSNRPVGVLRTRDLLLAPASKSVSELMIRDVRVVPVTMALQDLAHAFEEHSFVGFPVVDQQGALIGVVHRNAVDEALTQRSDSAYLASQGIVGGEEFRTHPLHTRARRRFLWLVVNLGLNMASASVIAFNQETLSHVIALAVFLPVLSDMSGSSGQQAIAVSIRELTLGLVKPGEILRVIAKEISCGMVNGLLLSLLVGTVAALWSGTPNFGLAVGGALGINIIVASCLGGVIPLVVKSLGYDPALASGLILTTLTDMCGFLLALTFAAHLLM